jgi:hypothetical protein
MRLAKAKETQATLAAQGLAQKENTLWQLD